MSRERMFRLMEELLHFADLHNLSRERVVSAHFLTFSSVKFEPEVLH